jgi:hypothetical protein
VVEINLRVDDQNVKTTVLVQYNIFLVLKVNALPRSCNSLEVQIRASTDGRSTSDDSFFYPFDPFLISGSHDNHPIILQP